MLDSKFTGNLTELQCLAEFTKHGCYVSIPYGDCARYDFIADIKGKLYKIQCKTSSKIGEGIYQFSCRSTAANHSRAATRTYTEEEIDFFATIIEGKCYIVPVQETGGRSKNLRFIPPRNGQKAGVSFARDYEIETQIAKLRRK